MDAVWVLLMIIAPVLVVALVGLLAARRRSGTGRTRRDQRRSGRPDTVSPYEASDRASGQNAWMRGGGGSGV